MCTVVDRKMTDLTVPPGTEQLFSTIIKLWEAHFFFDFRFEPDVDRLTLFAGCPTGGMEIRFPSRAVYSDVNRL